MFIISYSHKSLCLLLAIVINHYVYYKLSQQQVEFQVDLVLKLQSLCTLIIVSTE